MIWHITCSDHAHWQFSTISLFHCDLCVRLATHRINDANFLRATPSIYNANEIASFLIRFPLVLFSSFFLVTLAEQNGNVKRPSVWSCWPKQVIMLHSKDCTAAHRILGHGRMQRQRPHLAKGHQPHHHPPPICTIAKRQRLHFKNHYHIVCIRAYRPWAHWAVCPVQVLQHFRICLHRVRCHR